MTGASTPGDAGADLRGVLRRKRDGGALSPDDCARFLDGVARGEVGDAEQVALLASIWFHGMAPDELSAWTGAMVASGDSLDLSSFDAPRVDKHSTGGVGDKVSLPLAPALAACGCVVPMISGRGLGHTGGTLDKLEAVPGVRTDLGEADIVRILREVGCVICAQTERIAPADRVLYAMRDRVELVESLPLIASSIVSKKVAEDIDALVLDVKAGSGAFLVDVERGRELAQTMVDLAAASGVRASARITWMGRPLGRAVGHALEVEEARRTLIGDGPADLVELVETLGADLLVDGGLCETHDDGRAKLRSVIADGSALNAFARMLDAQGGTGESPEVAPDVEVVVAESAGVLRFGDVREVGYAVRSLGGGRAKPTDAIDPAVGVVWRAVAGDSVERGDPIVEIHHRAGRGLAEARSRLHRAARIEEDDGRREPDLLLERILPRRP